MKLRAISLWLLTLGVMSVCVAQPYYVSPTGDDANPGTSEKPFATLRRAQAGARTAHGKVILRGGIYYLDAALVFTAEDSGTAEAPVVYENFPGEIPVLSGSVRLSGLDWQPYGNGIFCAQVSPELRTEELFVNGEQQVLARYPNYDVSAKYFNGYSEDSLSRERVGRWANPVGAYLHAMHPALWGDCAWRVLGKDDDGKLRLEGGWQNNRGSAVHPQIRFVENVFEELDVPGEWFLDEAAHRLYLFPRPGLDLSRAVVEAVCTRSLVEFRGDEAHPVRWLTLRGLSFRHAARTFMETREPLLRSDWTIYRGGAVVFHGCEDCALEDCLIGQVGGNAVFIDGYNRRVTVRGTRIAEAGASGVCLVGETAAARSPLFSYEDVQDPDGMDRVSGPKTDNYPSDCLVEDCLIQRTGRVEKQSAGVEIDLASRITVRHCSIYDMPRAGINIGGGCWGGHVVEFCDIFDTVKETGDHGSFNSWGRDRFWRPNGAEVDACVRRFPALPRLDAVQPILLWNNRWRCDHGWDIDLDDGSSNYEIRNNLCLRGGIKNREGYGRVVENNIIVGAGYDPHVWYANSGDVFRHNIVWSAYHPANMPPPPWGAEMDSNLVHRPGVVGSSPASLLHQQSGRDEHSIIADAHFVDPASGDYRVREDSPALGLGFVNFPMDRFGVQKPALRAMARTPQLPVESCSPTVMAARDAAPVVWYGARVRNIIDEGEMSVFGLPSVRGVLVLEVPPDSPLAKAGLRAHDVIRVINGEEVADTKQLLELTRTPDPEHGFRIGYWRDQSGGYLVLKVFW